MESNIIKARKKLDFIENKFKEFYIKKKYIKEESIKITSGFDPTVRFIGSHISVLKPYFLEKKIPRPGIYMTQPCVRTWNAGKILDENFNPDWGSYFRSLGTILPIERGEEAFLEMIEFLEVELKIPRSRILLRINSRDKDLMKLCSKYFNTESIEIDSMPFKYYRHTIGEEGVIGRNFNIAIANPSEKEYSDIGNYIVFEKNGDPLGIEIALGTSTIVKEIENLEHILDCYGIETPRISSLKDKVKFLDSLITSTILIEEGLKYNSANSRNRTFKKYLNSLKFYKEKLNISDEKVFEMILQFQEFENKNKDEKVANKILKYLNKI